MLSYKFRLYPSEEIQTRLNEQLELCRWLYSRSLFELNKAKEEGKKLKQTDTQALIVKLKKVKPELNEVHSKVLQMVNHQLWSNLKALSELKKNGKKVGKLRFKTGNSFKTMNFNQSGFKIKGNKLILSKVGSIPIKLHREINGKVKGIIIKRENSGRWYSIFQVEDEPEALPPAGKSVGIDVGVKHFLTDSDGRQVENPRFYEKTLDRIRILQRELSRKQKGSKNWEKCRIKLAKAYEKLVNQRNDFLHKLSRFYVNSYDVIAVEELKIRNMVRSNLAQKILDASWGKFIQILSYKAERADRKVVKVNPRGTSQEYKYGELDRDYNASLNILERALSGLGKSFEPVERRPLLHIPAKAVVMGQVFSEKQEATGFSL